jgi:putative spermidine/putrescine transport system permease protein
VIALVASDFTAIRILSGARVGTVMASMTNQIYNVQYPPASASAIVLLLAVLLIVGIIMRLVDVRKQL